MYKKVLLSLVSLLFVATANAQSDSIFTDDNFGKEEFDLASKDLTSAFLHTTNSGGSSLGNIWGFEVGLVFGGLESDNLRTAAESASGEPQDDLKYLPYAGLIGGVSLPFGIGAEVSLIPEVDIGEGDGSFGSYSGSLRWTVTDFIPLVGSFSPLKITARLSYGTTDFVYETSLNGGTSKETAEFNIENTEYGVTAGFNLFILEPYVGLSHVSSKSSMDAATTNPIIPVNLREKNLRSSLSGTRGMVGLLFKLPLLRFGLEMSNYQGVNRYTGKISFKI
jgi:hypothetical protein